VALDDPVDTYFKRDSNPPGWCSPAR